MDAAIETPRPHQGRIEHIRTVGGSQQDHARVFGEAIHLGEQLVKRLLTLIVAAADACAALAAHRIDLIDEHDAGSLFFGLAEQIAHTAGAHTHKQLHEFGSGHGKKRHPRFPGDRLGEEGFARARRTHQQHTFGNAGTHGGEPLRLLQERHNFLEFLFRLLNTRHILKAHRHRGFALGHARLAAAKAHGAVGYLGGATQQQCQAAEQQQQQQPVRHKACRGLVLAFITDSERNPSLLGRTQQQLVVAEDRHGHLFAIGIGDLHLPLARREQQLFHRSST
jgi:hypothetical protein